MAENRISEEERQRRLRARRRREQKRRQELRRRRRRRALMLRALLALIAAALIGLLIWGISSLIKGREERPEGADSAESQAENITYEEVSAANVLHLSFPTLLAEESAEAGNTAALTVEEFNQILEDLYQRGYVLVDVYELAEDNGSGGLRMGTVQTPEGKLPLILSQRDVSYPLDQAGVGYASKLTVDDSGNLVNELEQDDGAVVTGAYDVVPCVEAFIREHPDFSCQGARGILGLTGYNGILGYRTSPELGKSAAEGNPYADTYGIFDTEQETAECRSTVQALKDAGWRFASYGYDYVSYGSELSLVKEDAERWESSVEPLLGETDILIYPWRTDLGSWSAYGTDNEKYEYLRSLGFQYFFIADDGAGFLQVGEDYVHQGVREIGSYGEYQEFMAGA